MKILYGFMIQLSLSLSTFALQQEPFIRSLTIKDGLPQQQVMCYYEDSRGFLCIGTKGGLARYDGKNFKNF